MIRVPIREGRDIVHVGPEALDITSVVGQSPCQRQSIAALNERLWRIGQPDAVVLLVGQARTPEKFVRPALHRPEGRSRLARFDLLPQGLKFCCCFDESWVRSRRFVHDRRRGGGAHDRTRRDNTHRCHEREDARDDPTSYLENVGRAASCVSTQRSPSFTARPTIAQQYVSVVASIQLSIHPGSRGRTEAARLVIFVPRMGVSICP